MGLLLACTAPLIPGETVLGVDVAAEVVWGEANSRFGSSIAWNGESLLVAAPGEGVVYAGGVAVGGPADRVG